ncbi:E2F/DP family winged-helix DNA-binding domain [Musa troglodytarum]|uniref:E2F/DP family winged-helix DNA-binding domain n=1 Tax=Musa troglodytarum TaxID=320322 RepID=A0A9E7LAM1_9LILI|nr:E2F/DP family winged-helix DNA-binding domain [Musa troglodytarum]
MSSSSSHPLDSGMRHHAYSRKQKSLGLLCANFVSLYNRDGVDSIGLDDAARRLGVERRRIYDIVNIMESVGVLARKAKNAYSWIGFSGIPKALDRLEEEARRGITRSEGSGFKEDLEDELDESPDQYADEGDEKPSQIIDSSSLSGSACCKARSANRREKSLGTLTENFIKLFLTTDGDTISLDDAARLLLGAIHDASYMRTKIRRLYDIANVLSSINLIEKTQVEARKPAFRWLGLKEGKMKADNTVTVVAPGPKKPMKRAFGTEITNVDSKKSRPNLTADKKPTKVQTKSEDLNECNRVALKQVGSKSGYAFGPFHPNGVMKRGADVEVKCGKGVQDWESLAASFRPQYHNQGPINIFIYFIRQISSICTEG